MFKLSPNSHNTFSYTKEKKGIFCNFLNHDIIVKIGKKLDEYQKFAESTFRKKQITLADIDELQRKNRIFRTAIMFIIENFEKRSDILSAVRWPRPIYVHASLLHMEKLLQKTGKSLAILEKSIRLLRHEEKKSLFSYLKIAHYKYRIDTIKLQILSDLQFIAISFNEFDKEYEITRIFKKDLVKYSLPREKLQVGDVILWYKNENYLKQDFYSKLISIAEHSNITHASIVSTVDGDKVEHINPDNLDKNLIIYNENLTIPKNVVLFIMRPQIAREQKQKFLHELHELKEEITTGKVTYKFPTVKIWYAGFIGYIYMMLINYFHTVFILKNIFKQENTLYCGELIDVLFKRIGILILPRSEYDSIIGPSEILYSPYLKFVGAMYNPDEIEFVQSEDYFI